ncbi:MAG: NgoFVII family restriction endonuclease [Phascolarctobacterium sp.]|nr:NgoFVII family restriction endonuclease [Phascolarctobacterium sp.]
MENLSLFNFEEETTQTIEPIKEKAKHQLDIVKTQFLGIETLTWQELFKGFETIHAITYSSDINFLNHLLKLFTNAEIIFGCEATISFTLQEIMAFQTKIIEKIRSKSDNAKINLIERIENDTLKMYVARTQTSHQKIYLLSAEDGRKRVVFGSANMSFNAFSGKQLENISFCDDEEAYEWYIAQYQNLKENSSDVISQKAFLLTKENENIENLPIFETVEIKKALVIEPTTELNEEIQFILDTQGLAKKLNPCMPKAEKKGLILLDGTKAKIIKRQILEELNIEKKKKSAYPQLIVDLEKNRIELNGQTLNLNPSEEEIKNDIKLFCYYMNGFTNFHGDYTEMQLRYFEFANWFFCSPFMATLRNIAVRYNQNLLPYPVFGLLYGQSKAGKTSFLETLLKMMIGQKIKIAAPEFTRTTIEGLKRTVQGAPIIVDDLTNQRFKAHAIETIKNDDFGIPDNLITYPAVVISANEDVKAVAPEIVRRTVICSVQAGLTNTEVMRSNIVKTVQREIGTAFYREYLKRMLNAAPQFIDELKSDSTEHAPDILAKSSEIILAIFKEYAEDELPFYVKTVTLDNYFSEQVTGKNAIKKIQRDWNVNKKSFQIIEQTNELRYQANEIWEADRLRKELPETLEVHISKDILIMNLKEARKFFKINFKKSFFDNFNW